MTKRSHEGQPLDAARVIQRLTSLDRCIQAGTHRCQADGGGGNWNDRVAQCVVDDDHECVRLYDTENRLVWAGDMSSIAGRVFGDVLHITAKGSNTMKLILQPVTA